MTRLSAGQLRNVQNGSCQIKTRHGVYVAICTTNDRFTSDMVSGLQGKYVRGRSNCDVVGRPMDDGGRAAQWRDVTD